jgi:hypothetical protein
MGKSTPKDGLINSVAAAESSPTPLHGGLLCSCGGHPDSVARFRTHAPNTDWSGNWPLR